VQHQVCKAAKVAVIRTMCRWLARTGIVYRVGDFVVAVTQCNIRSTRDICIPRDTPETDPGTSRKRPGTRGPGTNAGQRPVFACFLLLACASCFWLSVRKGMGATRILRAARTAARAVTSAKAAQCFAAKNGARQRPSPGRRAKASSGERCGFAWIYIRTPPLSSLVLSPL
jgi:hypothetical protein